MANFIQLDYSLACEFLTYLKVDVDTQPGSLNLLCLQGVSHTSKGLTLNKNTPNEYNDTIALIYHDADTGKKTVTLCVGTTDPGRYYTEHSKTGGAAHLTFGQHLYTKGLHKGHPALRSLNEVNRIWRDRNGNFKPDVGEMVVEGYYGVNVHAGGKGFYVGKWSAGCINIAGGFDGRPYQDFIRKVDASAKVDGVVRVTVWRGVDLFKFEALRYRHRPTLVMGMKNGWVVELQRLLRKNGIQTDIDGDWRSGTTKAVVRFQQSANLTPDGWVGGKTWKALLS